MTVMTDTDLQPGARNAIRVCLNVQPHERVTLITDEACHDIAEALAREIEAVGAPCRQFVLEREGARPLSSLPATIAADMELSAVSIFAAHAQANELGSRMQMTDIVNRRRMRHAHMVNINRQIMLEGMRADYGVVDRISRRVLEIVQPARTIRATTAGGHRHQRDAQSRVPLDQDERPDLARKSGATCRAGKCSRRLARSTGRS